MKKKIFKILIICFFVLFILFEIYYGFFIYLVKQNHTDTKNLSLFYRHNFSIDNLMKESNYRKPNGIKYKNKKSIIVFGCGFAAGVDLKDNQTFEKKLSDYLKVPVYNRGLGVGAIQHAILQVQSGKIDDIIKQSNIAIYITPTIMDAARLKVYPGPYLQPEFLYSKEIYPVMKQQNDDLVLINPKFPTLTGNIFNRLITKFNEQQINDIKILTQNNVIHFKKLNKELKAINPNIKFFVLLYWDNKEDIELFNNLMQIEGISVILVSELTKLTRKDLLSSQYRTKINQHPNEEVWNILTPAIAKKLK